MIRSRIFTPFDADSMGGAMVTGARGLSADVVIDEVATPTGAVMLSDVVASMPQEPEQGPGTSRPLDNVAKWRLSELAERAYLQLKSIGLLAGETLEGYRRRISIKACGKRISMASHGDRMAIQSEFLREMGRAEEARRAAMKAQGTAKDIALHKLWQACAKTGTPRSAAYTIAARFYKGARLEDLSAKQIWSVIFTINNNANAKRGAGCKANRFKSLKAKKSL